VNALNLGIVTNGSVGWKTVRARWETDLVDYAPTIHHIEDHARWAARLTERYAKSVGLALAGRAAASEAIRSGADVVLLSTLQNAPFVPLPPGVNYLVYGDCTTTQLAELYGGKKLGFPGSAITARLRRLVDHGCYFLCMSAWYRDALRRELGVSEDRLVLLPFYVDTEKWQPPEQKLPNAHPGIVRRWRLPAQGLRRRLRIGEAQTLRECRFPCRLAPCRDRAGECSRAYAWAGIG
jgi:hypothetical protein